MVSKETAVARARAWGHKSGGRVLKALDKVFDTAWPAGTNIQLKFYELMRGTPYGAKDRCMDSVVDCAELSRIGNYIFHGIDIGNYSDAQFKSKYGKTVTTNFADLPKCRPLDQAFYKTSATKKTGHTSIIFDSKRIIHSGAKENGKKVDFSAIGWGKKYWKKGMCVKRFLTDAQYANVIVSASSGGGTPTKEGEIELKKGDKGAIVGAWQTALIQAGYPLPKYGVDNDFGSETETATNAFKKANDLPQDGVVDEATAAAMWKVLAAKAGDTSKIKALENQVSALTAKIEAAKKALA
jgi:hypothetical protein